MPSISWSYQSVPFLYPISWKNTNILLNTNVTFWPKKFQKECIGLLWNCKFWVHGLWWSSESMASFWRHSRNTTLFIFGFLSNLFTDSVQLSVITMLPLKALYMYRAAVLMENLFYSWIVKIINHVKSLLE